ncbi:prepilin-type N-terminal cleavage/methylation domain-containing protein [Bacillus sp. PAMC26568]|nr:prepilin-type N-terminal cleavage/methylation domain-containing protein [Bacillus sp. PAMC26568]
MFKKMLKNERGLTLIELLAVVVILGIIAAIAVPSIGNVMQNSRIDAIKADAIQILNASTLHEADQGQLADGAEWDQDDLSELVDSELVTSFTVSREGNAYILNAGPITVGNETVTFTDASKTEINNETAAAFTRE